MGLAMPLSPMLLSSTKEPFDDPDFLYEWKVDGVRCIAYINGGKVRLFSRHGLECTQAFPDLSRIANSLHGESAILDGELCVMVDGKPSLESVMERYMAVKSVGRKAETMPASFVTWDIIELNGKNLGQLPLIARKEILHGTVGTDGPLTLIDSVDGQGQDLFKAVCSMGLEGIVAKKKTSRYRPGIRSKDWIKIKNWTQASCVILGYRTGEEPGILLGAESSGAYIGFVEHGLKKHHLKALEEAGRLIVTKRDSETVWLTPLLRCTVRHVGWTTAGHMRDLYFEGFIL